LAVLDAHGGRMAGRAARAALDELTTEHLLRLESAEYWRQGAAIVSDDGTWAADPAHPALRSARAAVRDLIHKRRQQRARGTDPSVVAASIKRAEERQAAHAAELARLRRAVVHVFPGKAPEAAVLVDVARRELVTFMEPELEKLRARLAVFDLIGAIEVRPVLRALAFEPGERRLADLGPPQKTRRLNRAGRTLKITLSMLVAGSCRISKPFGDPKKLRAYLDAGELTKFRRRLEADAKSLVALYQYGRLHGGVRLRWGFLDEMIPAPWRHPDEPGLYSLMREAHRQGRELEVVAGSAPGWADPWSRARTCVVEQLAHQGYAMFDEHGMAVDEWEVQMARMGG